MGIRHTHLGAGRPVKHPGRNLQPTVRIGTAQAAAKNSATRPLDRRVNADPKTKPRMPWEQQFSKLGSVGVLKTRSGLTPQSDTSHQHQRCLCLHSPRGRLRYADRLRRQDRKSTRLNSSHSQISYAVFCLKKKKARSRTDISFAFPPRVSWRADESRSIRSRSACRSD